MASCFFMGKGSVLEPEFWGLQLLAVSSLLWIVTAVLVEMVNKGLDDLHPLKIMFDCCNFFKMASLDVLFNMCC